MELTQEQVVQLAQAWQPTPQERRWESIGWAESLTQALALGQKNKRLIFLFTLDGRMQRGRC